MLIWQAHKGKIESAAFSPDGQYLATATGGTRMVYLSDPTTGTLVRRLTAHGSGRVRGSVHSVAFAKDAPLLAAGLSGCVLLWRTDSWEIVAELDLHFARELAFGPGESPHLAASNSGWVGIWNDAGQPRVGGPRAPNRRLSHWSIRGVAALDFSPDGRDIVTSTQSAASLWNVATGKRARTIRGNSSPNRGAIRFSPDGSRVLLAHGKWAEVISLDPDSPSETAPETAPETARSSLLQTVRRTLSSAYRLWSEVVNQGPVPQPLVRIVAGTGRWPNIWAVAWARNGQSFLTAGNDGLVRLWDATTGAELKTYDWQIGKLYCATFSPDGLTCAACGARGQVVIWDVDE